MISWTSAAKIGFISLVIFLTVPIWTSAAQSVSSTCPENCTANHQHEFNHEIRNYTKIDFEIVNLAQLVSFMKHLYSTPGISLLERICSLNQRLNTCLSECPDNISREIHTKKSSIYFLMCNENYRNNAACLMNSTLRSSSFMDKIETVCQERVSLNRTRSLWEHLCQMARCRLLCLKKPITTQCGEEAFETARIAALAAIDEYEGTYLSQSTSLVHASGATSIVDNNSTNENSPTFWNVLKDNFNTFCDRKQLLAKSDDWKECVE